MASGAVSLLFYPYSALSGHTLDFIGLDGTAALCLDAAAADADPSVSTLTWSVATQPWREGDQLMLRIGKTGTPGPTATSTPTTTLTPTPTPTPTPEPETSDVVDRYDTNDDGNIHDSEQRQAVRRRPEGRNADVRLGPTAGRAIMYPGAAQT